MAETKADDITTRFVLNHCGELEILADSVSSAGLYVIPNPVSSEFLYVREGNKITLVNKLLEGQESYKFPRNSVFHVSDKYLTEYLRKSDQGN